MDENAAPKGSVSLRPPRAQAVALAAAGPFIGLAYVLALPFIAVVLLVAMAGTRAVQAATTVRNRLAHSTLKT